ncbi:MarR family winged helix-turn-helix transcriptional regulator [Noviherbaspirillum sedimenti]|uniref:MarR family transcriptional regulator n=1 Tax=Noviherbaspirillum sedimenti TaxID=2320865 RepID=A0A3A3G2C8_9BURK|nr:MarR family transcriptional regulator [Noviherbaspirillum sedimenti]RJG02617.1 MarR family transcriptional regulator [Noviherbaspirillum sedimenti]
MKSKPEKITELHDYLAYWLHRQSDSVLKKFERTLAEYGVTHAQWYVLITIYHQDADTPQSIAKRIDIDIGSVSRVIDRLVAKGLLVKRPHAEDKRSVFLELTTDGEKVISTLAAIARQQEGEWRACLTETETKAFGAALYKLLEAQGIQPTGRLWTKFRT